MITLPDCALCQSLATLSGTNLTKPVLHDFETLCNRYCAACMGEIGLHSIQHPHRRKDKGVVVCTGMTAKELIHAS